MTHYVVIRHVDDFERSVGGRDWVAGRFESYRDAYAYVVTFTNAHAYELSPARTDVIYGRRLFLFDNDTNGAMSINVRTTD